MEDYYKKNLEKLGEINEGSSIQIKYEGKKTNYLSINKESLKALKEFINNIKI